MGELININGQIFDSQISENVARDAEFIAADAAHAAASNPHPQYMLANPTGIEFGSGLLNVIDFHTGETYRDFDVRFLASGGGIVSGLGELLLQCSLFKLNTSITIKGGAQISRLLTATTSVDLPPIAAGATTDLSLNIANAAVGDLAFFAPTQLVPNISFFNIKAIINSTGVAQIRFHNLATTSVDLAPFTGRLLVIGF
jgi:hypothetical protein